MFKSLLGIQDPYVAKFQIHISKVKYQGAVSVLEK